MTIKPILPLVFLLISESALGLTEKQRMRAEEHRAQGIQALKNREIQEACEEFLLSSHYLPDDNSLKQHLKGCSKMLKEETSVATKRRNEKSSGRQLTREDRHVVGVILRALADAFTSL